MRRDRHHVRWDGHHVTPFLSYLVDKNVFFELTLLLCNIFDLFRKEK